MTDNKSVRLNKLIKEFNVSIDRIYEFLSSKGIKDLKPNTKVSHEVYMDLLGEFDSEKKAKLSAALLAKEKELTKAEEIIKQQEATLAHEKKLKDSSQDKTVKEKSSKKNIKIVGQINSDANRAVDTKKEEGLIAKKSNTEEETNLKGSKETLNKKRR